MKKGFETCAVCSFCFGNTCTMRAYLLATLYRAMCYLQVYFLLCLYFVQLTVVEFYSDHSIRQKKISKSTFL